MSKPFSQSCENNKDPILSVLLDYLQQVDRVLEVGSGTGQHAVYFAAQMPHLVWQSSDRQENIEGINQWLQSAGLDNTPAPLILDVREPWPIEPVPAIFTANSLHIMGWEEVQRFFAAIAEQLLDGGLLCVYGPFNYHGTYTSDSNARFDDWLKQRDPKSAIRDFEAVDGLAQQVGLQLLEDRAMPANNRCLVWRKHSSA